MKYLKKAKLSWVLIALGVALGALASSCSKREQSASPTNASPHQPSKQAENPYLDPDAEFAIEEAPPVPKPEGNPFTGMKLWVDPDSFAMQRANALRASSPATAAILDRIAKQPQALWLGEWNSNVYRMVEHVVSKAKQSDAVPIFVAYNVPGRDCGQHSAGGLKTKDAYRRWIRRIAAGISQAAAVVILEPDALPMLDACLNSEQQQERLELIADATRVLRQNPRTIVYIDAGHAVWKPAEVIAERLKRAGISSAHGFALNTSNYGSIEENLEFGRKVGRLVDGAHFVVDTSRNGAGYAPKHEWCNPPGRKLGRAPTTETGDALVDAYLWLKRPGESDGECNGGPKAGSFWLEQALDLAR